MSQIPERLDVKVTLPWPSKQELGKLVEKAGKLFIWAATAVRFAGDGGTDPITRLRTLLHEDISTGSRNPYEQLDSLYMAILSQAAKGLEIDSVDNLHKVIGTIIRLRSEMPLDVMACFLGEGEIEIGRASCR